MSRFSWRRFSSPMPSCRIASTWSQLHVPPGPSALHPSSALDARCRSRRRSSPRCARDVSASTRLRHRSKDIDVRGDCSIKVTGWGETFSSPGSPTGGGPGAHLKTMKGESWYGRAVMIWAGSCSPVSCASSSKLLSRLGALAWCGWPFCW